MSSGISFRFGDRWDLRDFVMPRNPEVLDVAKQFRNLPDYDRVIALWKWVLEEIDYPYRRGKIPDDYHSLHAFPLVSVPIFGQIYRIRRGQNDFWQLPSETIIYEIGDCEDTSILLCSLLRAYDFVSPDEVFVVCGTVYGSYHCWVEWQGKMLETTFDSLPPSGPTVYNYYEVLSRFNDIRTTGSEKVYEAVGKKSAHALLNIEQITGQKTKLRD